MHGTYIMQQILGPRKHLGNKHVDVPPVGPIPIVLQFTEKLSKLTEAHPYPSSKLKLVGASSPLDQADLELLIATSAPCEIGVRSLCARKHSRATF